VISLVLGDARPRQRMWLLANVSLVRVWNTHSKLCPRTSRAQGGCPQRNATLPRNARPCGAVQPVSRPTRPVPRDAALLHRILTLKEVASFAPLEVFPELSFRRKAKEGSSVPALATDRDSPLGEIDALKTDTCEFAQATACCVKQL
jgi:hypothetical protein